MSTMIEQPITMGSIIKNSIHFYGSTLRKINPILIIFAILMPCAKFVVAKIYNTSDLYTYVTQYATHIEAITIINIGILVFIITLFLNSSMIYLTGKNIKNETIGVGQSLQKALNKLVVIICSQITLALTIVALALICFLIGKLTVVGAGLLILSLLLIIIMVRMNFFIPSILFDNAGIFQSLRESYKITIHYWWRTFALTIIAGLPHVPFIMAQHFVVPSVAIILQIIDMVLVTPFTYNILLLQFFDLKVRHR